MAFKFTDGEKWLLKIAGISAAVIAITNVYAFYRNNIWQPKVEVKSVDFKKGVAELIVNGKPVTIKGDSSYLIAGVWGLKFGYTFKGNGQRVYDRIEILKNGLVHGVIKKAEGEETVSFTANEATYYDDVFNGMNAMKEGEWINAKKFVGGTSDKGC
jgi:hypothetical protein